MCELRLTEHALMYGKRSISPYELEYLVRLAPRSHVMRIRVPSSFPNGQAGLTPHAACRSSSQNAGTKMRTKCSALDSRRARSFLICFVRDSCTCTGILILEPYRLRGASDPSAAQCTVSPLAGVYIVCVLVCIQASPL